MQALFGEEAGNDPVLYLVTNGSEASLSTGGASLACRAVIVLSNCGQVAGGKQNTVSLLLHMKRASINSAVAWKAVGVCLDR